MPVKRQTDWKVNSTSLAMAVTDLVIFPVKKVIFENDLTNNK